MKRIVRAKICRGCKKRFVFKVFNSEYKDRKYCSRNCANKYTANKNSKSKMGNKNPMYKHGLYSEFIRCRVPKFCQICGENNKDILIHHVDRNRKNNLLINLMAVCRKCHYKIHYEK